ncbi:hypothetical protein Pelo_2606 [Pelomyxa schiedti]|nr:hypothetical protein Pelo_2606 [Pelomyxa schiedti]
MLRRTNIGEATTAKGGKGEDSVVGCDANLLLAVTDFKSGTTFLVTQLPKNDTLSTLRKSIGLTIEYQYDFLLFPTKATKGHKPICIEQHQESTVKVKDCIPALSWQPSCRSPSIKQPKLTTCMVTIFISCHSLAVKPQLSDFVNLLQENPATACSQISDLRPSDVVCPLEDGLPILHTVMGLLNHTFSFGESPNTLSEMYVEIVHRLINEVPSCCLALDTRGQNPLHYSCDRPLLEKVALDILKARPEATNTLCTAPDSWGRTPLHVAIARKNIPIFKILSEACPQSLLLCDMNGETPVTLASKILTSEEMTRNELFFAKDKIDTLPEFKWTALHVMACNKNVEQIKRLLQTPVRISDLTVDNQTAAHLFLSDRHREYSLEDLEIIDSLISSETVNIQDCSGNSVLHLALRSFIPSIPLVQRILNKSANVNLLNASMQSPLYIACLTGNCQLAQILLNQGAQVNPTFSDWRKPVHKKVPPIPKKPHHKKKQRCLLIAPMCPPPHIHSPLIASTYSKNLELVSLLLTHGASPDSTDEYLRPFLWCFAVYFDYNWEEYFSIVKRHSLQDRINPKWSGSSLLQHLCKEGNLEGVSRLIEGGISMDSNTESVAIQLSAFNNYVFNGSRKFNQRRIPQMKENAPPLSLASYYGHLDIVKILVQYAKEPELCVAVAAACCQNHTEIALFLLEKIPSGYHEKLGVITFTSIVFLELPVFQKLLTKCTPTEEDVWNALILLLNCAPPNIVTQSDSQTMRLDYYLKFVDALLPCLRLPTTTGPVFTAYKAALKTRFFHAAAHILRHASSLFSSGVYRPNNQKLSFHLFPTALRGSAELVEVILQLPLDYPICDMLHETGGWDWPLLLRALHICDTKGLSAQLQVTKFWSYDSATQLALEDFRNTLNQNLGCGSQEMGQLTITQRLLFKACHNGNVTLVKALIDAGVSPTFTGIGGMSPVLLACICGQPQCVKILLPAIQPAEFSSLIVTTLRMLSECKRKWSPSSSMNWTRSYVCGAEHRTMWSTPPMEHPLAARFRSVFTILLERGFDLSVTGSCRIQSAQKLALSAKSITTLFDKFFPQCSSSTPLAEALFSKDAKPISDILERIPATTTTSPNLLHALLAGYREFHDIDDASMTHMAQLIFNKRMSVDINEVHEGQWTPLSLSLELKLPELAKLLVRNGADTTLSYKNITPIERAIRSCDDTELVSLLLEALKEKDTYSLLKKSITEKSSLAFSALLHRRRQTIIYSISSQQSSPPDVQNASISDLQILSEHFQCSPIAIAALCQHTKTLVLLLENEKDYPWISVPVTYDLLYDLCWGGCIESLKVLLEARPNFLSLLDQYDRYGFPPLWYASFGCQGETVKYLIKSGAPINNSCLWAGIEGGDKAVISLLLQSGATLTASSPFDKPKFPGGNALHYAAFLGCMDLATEALQAFMDVNQVDSEGNTPLDYAIAQGNHEIVQLLNSKGAKAKIKLDTISDPQYELCLFAECIRSSPPPSQTVRNSEVEFATRLLKLGADPFACVNSIVPMNCIVSAGRDDILKVFLSSQNATLDKATSKRWLKIATSKGNVNILKLLIPHVHDSLSTEEKDKLVLDAVLTGSLETLLFFESQFAEIFLDDNMQKSIIQASVGTNCVRILRYLIERWGIDVVQQHAAETLQFASEKIVMTAKSLGLTTPNLKSQWKSNAERLSSRDMQHLLGMTDDTPDSEKAKEIIEQQNLASITTDFKKIGLSVTISVDWASFPPAEMPVLLASLSADVLLAPIIDNLKIIATDRSLVVSFGKCIDSIILRSSSSQGDVSLDSRILSIPVQIEQDLCTCVGVEEWLEQLFHHKEFTVIQGCTNTEIPQLVQFTTKLLGTKPTDKPTVTINVIWESFTVDILRTKFTSYHCQSLLESAIYAMKNTKTGAAVPSVTVTFVHKDHTESYMTPQDCWCISDSVMSCIVKALP